MNSTRQWQASRFRKTPHSRRNQLARVAWKLVHLCLFRTSPRFCHGWRRFLLRCFGARVAARVKTFPSARIWAPWNLDLGYHCSLGDGADCYSVGKITIGANATISQHAVLCTATHDEQELHLPLQVQDIEIGPHAWICAEVFVMPGVRIGEGTVVGVRSTVFQSLPDWKVAFGSPCKVRRDRILRSDSSRPSDTFTKTSHEKHEPVAKPSS